MPFSPPSGQPGRLLAIGGTLAALLLVWFALVAPVANLFAARAEALAEREALYRRMRDIADTLPSLRSQAAAAVAGSGSADEAAAPVPGGTDAVAGAALQQRLLDMAASIGATLSSMESLPAIPVKGYHRIGVRVSLTAPWPVLIGLLQAVERGNPRMVVDDLQVRELPRLVQPADPPLDVGFTVLAFRAEPSASVGAR